MFLLMHSRSRYIRLAFTGLFVLWLKTLPEMDRAVLLVPSVTRCLYSNAFPFSLSLQLVSVARQGSMARVRRNPRRP